MPLSELDTSVERPEDDSLQTFPIQPDKAWADLPGKIWETVQIQACLQRPAKENL